MSPSPIRRLRPESPRLVPAESSSDESASLLVVENPDGSLLEGMPDGFKHTTPIVSPPRTPRTIMGALSHADLLAMFSHHNRIFLITLIVTTLIDTMILADELAIVSDGIYRMGSGGNDINWFSKMSTLIHSGVQDLSKVKSVFSVFPPHWTLVSGLVMGVIDGLVCISFFLFGFTAYVTKARSFYHWFSNMACITLLWQVLLSCADKLSLLLFLVRLACFTYARFVGDLIDDIRQLAALGAVEINRQRNDEINQTLLGGIF